MSDDVTALSKRTRAKMPKALDVCGAKARKGAWHRMVSANREAGRYDEATVFGILQEDLYGFLTACHYGNKDLANKAMLDFVGMCMRVLNGECRDADWEEVRDDERA